MKNLNTISKFQLFLCTVLGNFLLFAQEKAADLKIDVDIDKGSDTEADWMTNPLVWVIGGLVLILIIALVARGGGNKS